MSNVRRVYFYLVSLISLGILAAGVRGLLFLLFDSLFASSDLAGRPGFVQQQLSLGLAMTIIGGPLWYFFWRSTQRSVGTNADEIGATIRKISLNLIQVVTALIALFAAADFLKWLMGFSPNSPKPSGSLATLLVVASIWYYFWRISEAEGQPSAAAKTLRRWYVYILSGWGLVWLTVGLIQLVNAGILYLPLWGSVLASQPFFGDSVRTNISWIILGGVWWAFHWFRMSRGDVDSTLRQVYIYLLAIVGSSVAGLVALIVALYDIFVWAFGAVGNGTASYFQFLGWTIPTMVVAASVWAYHQILSQEEAGQLQERRLSSKRIHLYIMSFIGLGTLIAGLIILLGTLLDLITNGLSTPLNVPAGWWQKQLSLSLAFLLVASPLWVYYWNQIMRLAVKGGIVEWKARSRRIYLYVIIAAGIIAIAADLVNIVYQILNGALTGSFGAGVLRNARWSIQSVIVAAPVLIYHWRIARDDQHRGAEAAAVHKTVSLLAGQQDKELQNQIEKKLGSKVRLLRYAGTETTATTVSTEEMDKIAGEIQASSLNKIMVVVYQGKVLVFPYQE